MLPDGNVKREIVEVIIPRFKIGHTFDVNQTEGKPLVELSQQLTGELTDYQKELRDALLQISPVPVSFQPIEGSTNGFYSLDKNEITVDSTLSEKQSIKTPTPLFTIPIFQMHPRTLLPEKYRQNLSLMSYVSILEWMSQIILSDILQDGLPEKTQKN